MKALLKQHRQLKSKVRKTKKAIRNAQDSKKKTCIILEQIGREVSRFYVINKVEADRTVYMTKTQITVKQLQKKLSNAEKTLKTEVPNLETLENELAKLQAQIAKLDLEETIRTKTISLKIKIPKANFVSKKKSGHTALTLLIF